MRRRLRLPVSTALILTGMAATIAAGPGRAGTLEAAGFGPATTGSRTRRRFGRHHGAILGSLADSRPQGRTAETIVNLVTPITVRPSALT